MVFSFKFPDVGEGITEGVLVRWRVSKGDLVKEDDILFEVETDKAVVEIPSPVSGKVLELLGEPGDVFNVGDVVASFDSDDLKEEESSAMVGGGEVVKEASDVVVEVKKSVDGVLALPKVRKYARDNNVDLSKVKGSGLNGSVLLSDISSSSGSVDFGLLNASPSVRKYALSKSVDLSKVKGSGGNGKILREDIDSFLDKPRSVDIGDELTSKNDDVNLVEYKGIRKSVGDKMLESLKSSAQVTLFDEFNLSKISSIRKNYEKLSYLPFIVKALCLTLKKFPLFNSKLLDDKIELVKDINIGVAVDTSFGLFVPVIKNCDELNILDIKNSIFSLASKARNKELKVEDMKNSSFTVSSIGSIGVQGFTPILNTPETAILGVGRVDKKPWVVNDDIVICDICVFSLTFDHRVVDGADGARFMNELKRLLEDPSNLIVEMR